MTLVEFAIIIAALIVIIKIFLFAKRRLSLLFSILSLKKIDTVTVHITNFFALVSKKVTKKPFAKITVGDKIYAIRLFNGKGHSHAAHIVNESFASVFLKTGGAVKVRTLSRHAFAVKEAARVYFPRTVFLPDTAGYPDEIPILIFSPSPRELTYVTAERTSIKAAFTGDEIFGFKVFTKTTFANFIDRDSRGFFDKITEDIYSYDK